MKLTVIGSGSSGNCYVLEDDGEKVLLDLGVRWAEILRGIKHDPSAVKFALLSHMHGDHACAVKESKRFAITVYGSGDGCAPVRQNVWNRAGAWKIWPFPVKHTNSDGSDCPNNAYIVQHNGKRVLYMTDWQTCSYGLKAFKINHFVIAVNYSEIPEGENRGHVLYGHASLDTAKAFLLDNMTCEAQSVIATHLSETNADPDRIYRELTDICSPDILVNIAEKGATYDL